MERDLQFLLDMLQSAELILAYTDGYTKDDFVRSVQVQDAVIRRLLIIGEAARRISQLTRDSLPEVSWQEIKGMRNRLVHEYDDVNLNIVWDAVCLGIPPLVEVLRLQVPPEP